MQRPSLLQHPTSPSPRDLEAYATAWTSDSLEAHISSSNPQGILHHQVRTIDASWVHNKYSETMILVL